MWTLVSVGLGRPHHSETALKSIDWLAVRADSLYAPVPTSVSGLLHQFSKSPLTTFWSTSMPATDGCAMADSNQPAELLSLTTTVVSSGAVSPVMATAASFFSRSA